MNPTKELADLAWKSPRLAEQVIDLAVMHMQAQGIKDPKVTVAPVKNEGLLPYNVGNSTTISGEVDGVTKTISNIYFFRSGRARRPERRNISSEMVTLNPVQSVSKGLGDTLWGGELPHVVSMNWEDKVRYDRLDAVASSAIQAALEGLEPSSPFDKNAGPEKQNDTPGVSL